MILKMGKYKGQTVEQVAKIKQGKENGAKYLIWMKENTFDPNDPKYGESNKAFRAEIDRVLGTAVRYEKDNSQLPKGAVENQIEKKLDFLTEMFKKAYPEVYAELMFENSPQSKEEESPF